MQARWWCLSPMGSSGRSVAPGLGSSSRWGSDLGLAISALPPTGFVTPRTSLSLSRHLKTGNNRAPPLRASCGGHGVVQAAQCVSLGSSLTPWAELTFPTPLTLFLSRRGRGGRNLSSTSAPRPKPPRRTPQSSQAPSPHRPLAWEEAACPLSSQVLTHSLLY